jgi:hypothetical protein
MARIMKWLLMLALALLVVACSMVRLGYSQLPELSYWWLDSYLDLDAAQSTVLKADLTVLHTWHRQQELVWITQTLTQLESRALQDTTPAALCQTTDAVRQHLDLLTAQSVPMFTRLVISLKPAQLEHLQRQLAKRRQDWQEEWREADANKRRADRLIERTEQFYGRLDADQKALLRASLAVDPLDEPQMANDMRARHQDIEQTARKLSGGQVSLGEAATEMRALLDRLTRASDAPRNAQRQQSQCKVFADLHNSASVAQRQKLAAALKGYASDAQAMSLNLSTWRDLTNPEQSSDRPDHPMVIQDGVQRYVMGFGFKVGQKVRAKPQAHGEGLGLQSSQHPVIEPAAITQAISPGRVADTSHNQQRWHDHLGIFGLGNAVGIVFNRAAWVPGMKCHGLVNFVHHRQSNLA